MRRHIVQYLYGHRDRGGSKRWDFSSNQQNKNGSYVRQRSSFVPAWNTDAIQPSRQMEGEYLFLEKTSFLEGNLEIMQSPATGKVSGSQGPVAQWQCHTCGQTGSGPGRIFPFTAWRCLTFACLQSSKSHPVGGYSLVDYK